MRTRLIGLLLLVAFLTACAWGATPPTPTPVATDIFPSQTPPPSPTVEITPPADWQAAYAPNLVESQRARGTRQSGATEYRLDLTLSDDLLSLTGREAVTYTNRETVALNEVRFHLFARLIGGEMKVSNVAVDGAPVQEKYEQSLNSLLIVPLAAPLPVGAAVVISLDFTLKIPENPETSYGVLVTKEGLTTLAHSYPMVAVYQDGWDNTFPSTYGDLTYTDASFYTVNVTAPQDVTLIASGIQNSSQSNANSQTVQFILGPARDFMLVAARNYIVKSQKVGEITVNSYAPANTDERFARNVLGTAVEALRIFSQRYAPYPYTEFDVVATPTLAMGVEYPGLVAIAQTLYSNEAPSYFLESVVAHEAGHQWFYNLVGNDQLNQPWLDESLTQYITWQYYVDRYGEANADGFKASLEDRWAGVDNQPIPVGKPVTEYNQQQYSAIVYGRGALFFFALKDEIGQEAFDVFLKSYTEQFTWELSSTAAIEQAAEKSCGCQLEALFAEWIDP